MGVRFRGEESGVPVANKDPTSEEHCHTLNRGPFIEDPTTPIYSHVDASLVGWGVVLSRWAASK